MPKRDQQTTSYWQEFPTSVFPKLNENIETDVCVVGAGIAGLSAAHFLLNEGYKVTVIESGAGISAGQTIRTTAHLSNALDDRYMNILKMHGKKGAQLASSSHREAIDLIEAIVLEQQIDCDFQRVDGYLVLAPEYDQEYISNEHDACIQSGVEAEMVLRPKAIPFNSGRCLRFPNQAQFHPAKYMEGLARSIESRGGKIYSNSHVHQIKGGSDAHVETENGHTVKAKAIVVATNSPVNDRLVMHTKQYSYRTYVVAFEIPKNVVRPILLWDTANPYHYVRMHQDETRKTDVLIVGGEDHKTGQANDYSRRYRNLKKWTKNYFPMVGRVIAQWSGQVVEPVDALGYAGRNPLDSENVYVITGDSGNGLTNGTIGAKIVSDLVANRETPYRKLFDPARTNIHCLRTYAKENLNVAAQYESWLTSGDVQSVEDIPAGHGALVRDGLSKIAAYRDDKGELTTCSATCPHLGGIVKWNSGEKTWDCPCHGSRFDAYGKVIEGPAIGDLAPVNMKDTEVPIGAVLKTRAGLLDKELNIP